MRQSVKFGMAIACSLAIVVTAAISLLAYAVASTILEPYSWSGYLKNSGAYPKLAGLLADQMNVSEAAEIPDEQRMLQEAMAEAAERIVTPEWIEGKVDHLQTAFWDYILGKEDRVRNIPIPEVRDALAGELQHMIEQADVPEEAKEQWESQLNERVPTEIDVQEVFRIKEEDLQLVRQRLAQANEGAVLLFVLLAVWVAAGGLVAFYPLWLLRWFGYTAIVVGVIFAAVYFGAYAFQPQRQLERLWSDGPPEGFDFVSQLAMNVLHEVLFVMLAGFVAAFIAGGAAIAASHLPGTRRWHDAVRRYADRRKGAVFSGRFVGALALLGAMTAAIWRFAADLAVR